LGSPVIPPSDIGVAHSELDGVAEDASLVDLARPTIEERLAVLEQLVASQQRQMGLAAERTERDGLASSEAAVVGRRELLRRVGTVAATGAAASAFSIARAAPAAAADGDPLLLGVTGQTATSPTDVSISGTPSHGVRLSGGAASGSGGPVLALQTGQNLRSGLEVDGGLTLGQSGSTVGINVRATVAAITALGQLAGIVSNCDTGPGVLGASYGGPGLLAESNYGTAIHMRRRGDSPIASAPNRTGHTAGDLDTDMNHDLWWCTTDNVVSASAPDPTHWRKVAGPATAGALHLRPTPVRVYDSRPGLAPVAVGPKTPLVSATERTIDTTVNSSGVPAGATAVLVNVAATDTTGTGFVGLYKTGEQWPGTSNLNWDHPGATVSNLALTAVDTTGHFTVYAGGNGQLHVVVDLIAFYR
jgi:hypothetical protein